MEKDPAPIIETFTFFAGKLLLAAVRVQMFFLVGQLIEIVVASIHWAEERSFARVNSEVVKKIVPFPENSITSPVLFTALEGALVASGLRVDKLNLNKILRGWYGYASFEMGQINLLTVLQKEASRHRLIKFDSNPLNQLISLLLICQIIIGGSLRLL